MLFLRENTMFDQADIDEFLSKFLKLYQNFTIEDIDKLDQIYHPDILFVDPLHEIKGLTSLKDYFQTMYRQMEFGSFEYHRTLNSDNQLVVEWTMNFSHKQIKSGAEINFEGISRLILSDQLPLTIVEHRDYYDVGQMVYEHIPLLGSVIRFIKTKSKPA